MAFDRQSLYITAVGQLGTAGGAGEEIFSFGFRATGGLAFDAVTALGVLDVPAVAVRVGQYFESVDLHLHQDAWLYKVKVAALGTNGLYLTEAEEAEPAIGGLNGNDVATRHPNQIALAISTGTATEIGRAVRGRFYLPLPASGINTNGLMDLARATSAASATASLFDDLNVLLQATPPEISELAIMSSVGAGTTKPITRVRCGRVMDTIRSRRNALQEEYSSYFVVA